MKLSELHINQKAIVINVSDELLRTNLLEMGIIQGDEVELILKSPMGDPLLYQLAEGQIALRKKDAQLIDVEISE